ncbi:MAG: hypothetical protein IKJ30_00510 [Bacilli bacterium]|nr:hypothetical protein [Bacilli bacterium]
MKKVLTGLLSIGIVASSAYLAGCSCFDNGDPPGNPPTAEADGFVSLDINPSIELVVDENGKVINVYGTNEDAKVLLYGESGIVGKSIEDAVAKITTLAKELGYLTEDNDVVNVLSSGIDTAKLNSIKSKIIATAEGLGLTVTTDTEAAYSLLRDFEEYKAKFPTNQAIQNMTISKYKLALSVSETGDISLDTAVTMDDSALIDALDANLDKVEVFMTDAFNVARSEAELAFNQAKLVAEEMAYINYLTQKFATQPQNSYYPYLHAMYSTTAKGFELIADVVEKSRNIETHVLDSAQIESVFESLGMNASEIDKLKDEDGNVTIESVEAYADILFKNNPSTDWSATKEALDTTLDNLESSIADIALNVKKEFYNNFQTILNQTDGWVTVLEQMQPVVETFNSAKGQELATYIQDYKNIITQIEDAISATESNLNVDTLNGFVETLKDKADAIEDDVDAILTSDDKAQIATLKANAVNVLTAAKQALDLALSSAETSAKAALSNLKSARRNND